MVTNIESRLPQGKPRRPDRGCILNRNREASLEDSASVEGFLSVWGFNGEQRRSVVAIGGYG